MSRTARHRKGKRGQVIEPSQVEVPIRTVEEFATVRATTWNNRLISGDQNHVLHGLLPDLRGGIDLIYIDPPFFTGAEYPYTAAVPETNGRLTQTAYHDSRDGGLDKYLAWFGETIELLHQLLAPTGSIYVHLDWHVSHYAKVVLDQVFGPKRFINEITWKRSANTSSLGRIWKRAHDVILFYSKSERYTFHRQRRPLSAASQAIYAQRDERGLYRLVPLLVSGKRNGATGGPWRGVDPNKRGRHGMHWVTRPEKLEDYDRQGLIVWPARDGGAPNLKYYLAANPGVVVSDWWDDIPAIGSGGRESVHYPTQKPEALLERIIRASSREGDIVLDCFCGSGTTAVVAEKLNRRWIAADAGLIAIHTTRKRLLRLDRVRPFTIQNAGPTPMRTTVPQRNGRDVKLEVARSGDEVTVRLLGVAAGTNVKASRLAIRRAMGWVDYWAVDWNFDGRLFRPAWWALRGKGERPMPLAANHRYASAGAYVIAVQVIDLLGQELTHRVPVRVAAQAKGRRKSPAPLPRH
jgi:DNA modification methylase